MLSILPSTPRDLPFITTTLTREFSSTQIFSRRQMFDALTFPTYIATRASQPVGLSILRFDADECELLALVATEQHHGIGSALLDFSRKLAAEKLCRRLFLTTTNDNLDALRFYQRRGMQIAAFHKGAMDHARRLKPSIPEIGHYNIPMRDDLELEYLL